MKGTWKPGWVTDNRLPLFMGGGDSVQVMFGTVKYLWGNVPAIDVIKLGQNEGIGYQDPINLLFAGRFLSFCSSLVRYYILLVRSANTCCISLGRPTKRHPLRHELAAELPISSQYCHQ